ncbi:Beta-1,2-xylosyltransferase 1 [Hypsizygus marmoreus]|uniref:Beta-1,2-xylosyltransferase 1 n=1 Tax=Hypsizygus marmoreus TaxID=39966 RepID=A0A369J607_HYPMA|nr:Beta-1,2-xylosyltransferase 1 [Hypsizygus marmoreus]
MLRPWSRKTIRLISFASILTFFFSGFPQDAILFFLNRHDHDTTLTVVPPPVAPTTQAQVRERNYTRVLKELKFRKDGLVEADEEGPHPIYELIARAEKAWEGKLKRASTTLGDAVKEYKRRYRRPPPRGFDQWWRYAMKHNVQLPDEYDTIYHDLEPFWGIEPKDLLAIRDELELKKDSFTVGQTDSNGVGVVNYAFNEGTYKQLIKGSEKIVDLLKDVEEFLPSFRAVISPHDAPNRLSDYGVKSAALEAALSRTYIERTELPKINALGWVSACSPTSPARRKPINLDIPPPRPSKKTFIHDHRLLMDPCLHPNLLHQHGQFLSHNLGPTPQREMVPEFSFCSTTIHHNIRIPTPYEWVEDILPRSNDPEWDDKLDERLLWRGSNTGIFHADHTRWKGSHRGFVVGFTNELKGMTSFLSPTKSRREQVGKSKKMRNAHINPAIMDIAFAGKPISCAPQTCKYLATIFPWRERQSVKDAGNYKYVLDVDGNGWSGRFKRLITSNSLIFKATIYPEWYTDRIAPWVHYVPIQMDMSDLHDALVFFRGDGNGDGSHEDLARKIAIAGRQWSKTFWRREDLVAYFFRLILEYSRLMSLDREAMSYVENPS